MWHSSIQTIICINCILICYIWTRVFVFSFSPLPFSSFYPLIRWKRPKLHNVRQLFDNWRFVSFILTLKGTVRNVYFSVLYVTSSIIVKHAFLLLILVLFVISFFYRETNKYLAQLTVLSRCTWVSWSVRGEPDRALASTRPIEVLYIWAHLSSHDH